MVPTRYYWLDKLPVTNGKIDRKALEKLELTLSPTPDNPSTRSKLELQLVHIWQAVLRQERVGIRDNFVELGGDSLSATQVEPEIENLLGRKVPAGLLFRFPTIEALAVYLTQPDSTDGVDECASPLPRHPNKIYRNRGVRLRNACIEIWNRTTITLVRGADASVGPAFLPPVLLPRIVVDALRRVRDYKQFLRLRATLPANFWRCGPLRHYLRMIIHWQQSLAISLLADRFVEERWQRRIQIRGTPPDALPEWGKRPVVIAYLHTAGFLLMRYWLRSRGLTAATVVRARPRILRRYELRKRSRLGKTRNYVRRGNLRAAMQFLVPGHVLMVAMDACPRSRHLVMGAPIGINDGAVRLAMLSNALLLPASVWIRRGSQLMFCFAPPVPREIMERGDIVAANEYLARQLWNDLRNDRCAIGWTTLEAYSPEELIRPRQTWP
jgi:hypothetical protein